jgi:hypothetical protein
MAVATSTAILALTASSAFSTAANIYTQKKAITSQGKYESQVANNNAMFAELQAKDAIDRGDEDTKSYQLQVKKLMGSQRASLAAQGLDLGSGSALDVQADTAMLAALDALTIRNNAFREAWGYKVDALNYRSQAAFAGLTAKARARNTVLTGGMQLANIGTQFLSLGGGFGGGSGYTTNSYGVQIPNSAIVR